MSIHKITPMVPISDYAGALTFYTKGLGLRLVRGKAEIGWALLEGEGGCQLMIDRSIRTESNAATVVYYRAANLVSLRQQIVAAGYYADPIDVTFYGMTEFRVCDPDGNEIWVGAAP